MWNGTKKTANRPSERGEIKTMYPNNANETNEVGRQNKYLGDHHQNNNG